jgi:hypothetical protein
MSNLRVSTTIPVPRVDIKKMTREEEKENPSNK